MDRRTFITTTGMTITATAGCLGLLKEEPSGTVKNQVEPLTVSNVETSVEKVLGTKAFVVRGNLKNTTNQPVALTVKGVFYGQNDAKLGTNAHEFDGFVNPKIKPGEKRRFEVAHAPPDEVSRYVVVVGPNYRARTTTATTRTTETATTRTTETETETATTTQTPTPELAMADDWEDGNHTDNPEWSVESGAWTVTDVNGPDGGSKAFYGQGGDPSYVRTDRSLDFANGEFPWVIEGAYRLELNVEEKEVSESDYHRAEVALANGGWGSPSLVVSLGFEGNTDGDGPGLWRDSQGHYAPDFDVRTGTDYQFEVRHDGEGDYGMRLWEAGVSRPDSPMVEFAGDPIIGTHPLQLSINASVGFQQKEMGAYWHYVDVHTVDK